MVNKHAAYGRFDMNMYNMSVPIPSSQIKSKNVQYRPICCALNLHDIYKNTAAPFQRGNKFEYFLAWTPCAIGGHKGA